MCHLKYFAGAIPIKIKAALFPFLSILHVSLYLFGSSIKQSNKKQAYQVTLMHKIALKCNQHWQIRLGLWELHPSPSPLNFQPSKIRKVVKESKPDKSRIRITNIVCCLCVYTFIMWKDMQNIFFLFSGQTIYTDS